MVYLGGPGSFYNLPLDEQRDAMGWGLYEQNPKAYRRDAAKTGDAALDAALNMPDEEE